MPVSRNLIEVAVNELFERPPVSPDNKRRKRINGFQRLTYATFRLLQVDESTIADIEDMIDEEPTIELEKTILMFDKQNKEWGIYKDEGVKY